MIKEEKQYIPFGLEWYKEMKKLNKDTIISLVEKNCKERDKLREQNKQLQAKVDELEKANKNKYLTCVDCGKQDDTVKDRGAFNGIQCYSCKKEQDIDDEECR